MANEECDIQTFSKLLHVGVVVRDMEKAVERFKYLGIGPFESKSPPPSYKEWLRGKPSNPERIRIASSKMGDTEIELIQPRTGESILKEFLDNAGEGIQHIAYSVKNLDQELDRLTKKGVNILSEGIWPEGRFVYLDLDVGGIIVELIQINTE